MKILMGEKNKMGNEKVNEAMRRKYAQILDQKQAKPIYGYRCKYFSGCPAIKMLRTLSVEIDEDLVALADDRVCSTLENTECHTYKEFKEKEALQIELSLAASRQRLAEHKESEKKRDADLEIKLNDYVNGL